MIIRTQNRESLINFSKASTLSIEPSNEKSVLIHAYFEMEDIVIGQYESKERAIEVLDEISRRYRQIERSKFFGVYEASFEEPVFSMPEK